MTRYPWLVGAIALVACQTQPARSGPLEVWEPVDSAFAGCQGACGAHVEGSHADIARQPGASIGARTYCPVSGAVFEVDAEHPHVDVDGQTLWFCCAGCAEYFAAHQREVLEARGIGRGAPRASAEPPPTGGS